VTGGPGCLHRFGMLIGLIAVAGLATLRVVRRP
jgi:hypothetical protein